MNFVRDDYIVDVIDVERRTRSLLIGKLNILGNLSYGSKLI